MADMSWQNPKTQSEADSAVLDMEMDDIHSDMSDYDNQFQETPHQRPGESKKGDPTMMDSIKQRMSDNVTQMVWQAGTQSAKRAWSIYGNIDVLRPYFDVEPKEVQKRLLYSLIPLKPTDQRISVPKELYGPFMVVLTLIALLLYQMKSADHVVEEGTLMGSAFGVCFMYWFGSSALVWFLSYVCNVRMAILQILSMMGYAMFGHCIVLFLGTAIHTSHDHMFFYLLWAVIGGLSSLRMASIILSRTRGKSERMIVIGAIVTLHLLFLLYLHFAYHTIVEEISQAFGGGDLVPAPAKVPVVTAADLAQKQEALQHGADLVNKMAERPDLGVETLDNKVPALNPNNIDINQPDSPQKVLTNEVAVNKTLMKTVDKVTVAVLHKGNLLLDKLKQ